MSIPTRILVPLELSLPGETKLPVVEGYARAFGAEILLLHVLPRNPALAALGDLRAARRREDTDNTLDVPSSEEAAAREGSVVTTILEVARREGVELIVTGSNPGL